MKWIVAKCAIVAVATLSQSSLGAARSDSAAGVTKTIVLNLCDLRSAYLMRTGAVSYDAHDMSPAGIRRQLQRHFDVVLGILIATTPRNIELALDRLELNAAKGFTAEERAAWRERLLAMRLLQVERLAGYRDRGRFPLNESQSATPAPIFVDRHDTACAVGHLMRLSGWLLEVAEIYDTNNLVYVPEALGTSVASWVLTSGLTLEEAALIQPAYSFPGEFDAGQYVPGGLALEKHGLRFENFQLRSQRFVQAATPPGLPPDTCGTAPEVCNPPFQEIGTDPFMSLNGLGLYVGKGNLGSPFVSPEHDPTGTHWLAIGGFQLGMGPLGYPIPVLRSLNADAGANQAHRIVIRFDVSTIAPYERINQVSQNSYPTQSGFYARYDESWRQNFGLDDPIYHLMTSVFDGNDEIASLYVDQAMAIEPFARLVDTDQFDNRQKITIESEMWLQDDAGINAFLLDFNVVNVPEPVSAHALVMGLTLITIALRRRR